MVLPWGREEKGKTSLYQNETPRMAKGETEKYFKCSVFLSKGSFTASQIKALCAGEEDPNPRREASLSSLVGLGKSAVKATEGMCKTHLSVQLLPGL